MIELNKENIDLLFNKAIIEINENKAYEINNLTDLNNLKFSRQNGIVYLILVNNKIRYIGKSKGIYFRERIKNHFIEPNKGTKSKNDFIVRERRCEKSVTLKFIELKPEALRNLIEEILIEKYKNLNLWNYS